MVKTLNGCSLAPMAEQNEAIVKIGRAIFQAYTLPPREQHR
ncbi:MAG: hypothetical protein ACRC1U_10790 [Vibrionaceae bacterium]